MSLFLPIIDALNRASVDYVVVGGFATVLHGHTRMTTDVDLVIRLDEKNVLAATDAIASAGFVPRLPLDPADFARPDVRQQWISEKGLMVFSFYDPKNPAIGADLFAEYPIEYDVLGRAAVIKDIGNVKVRTCSIDHLIRIKRAAGRSIDLDDVAALEKIRGTGKA